MEFNFASRECNVKIVYYGPGLSGKTTNLEVIHDKTPQENRGNLTALATDLDRTLFFDYMPLELGKIGGLTVRLRLFTVPGQVYYNATRKLVLRCVDGVVFVADSQESQKNANLESLQNLSDNMLEHGINIKEIPLVLQFNKRDLPNIMSLETMDELLNREFRAPYFPAIAIKGDGVFQCLRSIANLTMVKVEESLKDPSRSKAGTIPPKPNIPSRLSSQSSNKPIPQESQSSSGSTTKLGHKPLNRPISSNPPNNANTVQSQGNITNRFMPPVKNIPNTLQTQVQQNLGQVQQNLGQVQQNLGQVQQNLGQVQQNTTGRLTGRMQPPSNIGGHLFSQHTQNPIQSQANSTNRLVANIPTNIAGERKVPTPTPTQQPIKPIAPGIGLGKVNRPSGFNFNRPSNVPNSGQQGNVGGMEIGGPKFSLGYNKTNTNPSESNQPTSKPSTLKPEPPKMFLFRGSLSSNTNPTTPNVPPIGMNKLTISPNVPKDQESSDIMGKN